MKDSGFVLLGPLMVLWSLCFLQETAKLVSRGYAIGPGTILGTCRELSMVMGIVGAISTGFALVEALRRH